MVGLRPGPHDACRRPQDTRTLYHRQGRLPRELLPDGRPIRHPRRSARAFRRERRDDGQHTAPADDPARWSCSTTRPISPRTPNHAFSVADLAGLGEGARPRAEGRVRGAAHRHVQGLGQRTQSASSAARSRPGRSRRSSSWSSSAASPRSAMNSMDTDITDRMEFGDLHPPARAVSRSRSWPISTRCRRPAR